MTPNRLHTLRLATLLCGILAAGCPAPAPEVDSAGRAPWFVDVAVPSGLEFVHVNGGAGEFYYPELLQPGCAFLDYDNDGLLDIYLVQGGPLPADPSSATVANRLFRNRGDGTFQDVTEAAGVGDRGYGFGAAVADYDRDGDVDLYVTNLGANRLYRNRGDGTFEDVSEASGVAHAGWSSSAAFFDYDADGDLDLFVGNYLDWSPAIERPCFAPNGLRDYCSPGVYGRPARDALYRNEGDGRFTDVSGDSGIAGFPGAALGVAIADFDRNGGLDIYVANDQMANALWINRGGGRFEEQALERGAALNESGRPEASMGVLTADRNADGWWELFMLHLDGETNTYYDNREGLFRDVTDALGLGPVSRAWTGFGVGLEDFDLDSIPDLFIANGRVRLGDTMEAGRYEEPNQLLRGTPDGRFVDISDRAGPALALREVSRGAAFGDYDNDGDVDVLLANNDGPVRLLRNDGAPGRNWIGVRLVGRTIDRDGIGSRVEIEAGGRRQVRRVQPAWSYGSSNDPRLHFGLNDAARVERLRVIWPDGRESVLDDLSPNRWLVIEEPS